LMYSRSVVPSKVRVTCRHAPVSRPVTPATILGALSRIWPLYALCELTG
jgi:hypothetical protein